jgi:DNA polymerase-1
MRTLLIDGDTLIYEAAAATEYETQWDEWLWTLHGDLGAAIAHLDGSVAEITDKLKPDRIIFALSDETRWRPSVMPTYKNKRTKTRKPVTYRPLREYCHETMNVFQRPSLEGDDVLGIFATHPKLVEGERIVVSIDKDMNTIPGLHLNYAKARGADDWEQHVRVITAEMADRYHLYQTLTGDSTDGYPGCPGVGPVKAEKILMENATWAAVVQAYKAAGLSQAVALQNARVARICRHTDYDFKNKEVILWKPTP